MATDVICGDTGTAATKLVDACTNCAPPGKATGTWFQAGTTYSFTGGGTFSMVGSTYVPPGGACPAGTNLVAMPIAEYNLLISGITTEIFSGAAIFFAFAIGLYLGYRMIESKRRGVMDAS